MITRKARYPPAAVVWPYTPDPSPPLPPTAPQCEIDNESVMSLDTRRSRPISMMQPRDGTLSSAGRPTLDDVLHNRAPAPFTLAAYTAYLSQQHCLETLEFVMESRKYREKYDLASAQMAGMPLNSDCDDGVELQEDWTRLLDIYVKPGAPREINLPAEERDDLVDYPFHLKPPPPEALDPAIKRMHDLMSDSIFIPFCHSLRSPMHARTHGAMPDFTQSDDPMDSSRLTMDDRGNMHHRKPSRRRQSPPATSSSTFERSSSVRRPVQSSSLSSALAHSSTARLSKNLSQSSATSVGESAVTDDSGGDSPGASEQGPMTPPTTPPTSDLPATSLHGQALQHPKPQRTESGGWKKMGMKIWGNKKKNGSGSSVRERSQEP